MNRNFESARHIMQNNDITAFCDSHNTDEIVACAIFAISGVGRTPQDIWEDPAFGEEDNIKMAMQEYIDNGDFEPDANGYNWGCEKITL